MKSLKKTLTFAVRIVAFITVPAAIGLVILREPIIRVLFQHGQFVAESTRLTARALLYYALGLACAGVRQTDRPGVLFGERHEDAGDRGVHFAGHEHHAEHYISRFLLQAGTERRAGAGHGDRMLLRFFCVVYCFPVALRSAWDDSDFPVIRQDCVVLWDYGRGVLVWRALYGVHHSFAVLRATAGVWRP